MKFNSQLSFPVMSHDGNSLMLLLLLLLLLPLPYLLTSYGVRVEIFIPNYWKHKGLQTLIVVSPLKGRRPRQQSQQSVSWVEIFLPLGPAQPAWWLVIAAAGAAALSSDFSHSYDRCAMQVKLYAGNGYQLPHLERDRGKEGWKLSVVNVILKIKVDCRMSMFLLRNYRQFVLSNSARRPTVLPVCLLRPDKDFQQFLCLTKIFVWRNWTSVVWAGDCSPLDGSTLVVPVSWLTD